MDDKTFLLRTAITCVIAIIAYFVKEHHEVSKERFDKLEKKIDEITKIIITRTNN